jgi:adenylate cyclase
MGMGVEIERKFLVKGDAWKTGRGELIRQGYLSFDRDRTVRVRTSGDAAWLTIKGKTTGATRKEFEYSIPLGDALELLAMCERPILEKTRYRIEHAGRFWEIDEFHGENAGLFVAEVELNDESDQLELPNWIGNEVTNDPRYYNSNLAAHPYSHWG